MHYVLKAISFLFHPLIMPILGVLVYFSKSPRFYPKPTVYIKLFSLSILTVILPILIYFLLKTLGKTSSMYLKTAKERVMPLAINSIILFLIIKRVLPYNQILELHYFFVGILFTNLSCFLLALLKYKASIHMAAVCGLFMFFIAIALHFSVNMNGILIAFATICGAVATSRLHLKAHKLHELIVGSFVGFLPQLIVINYWL